jgi:hypothetical protein
MRRAILLAGLVLAIGTVTPASGLGKAGGTDLPVKLKGSGTLTVSLTTGAFHSTLTGKVSHLGVTRFQDDGFVFPTGPGQFGSVSHFVHTGASGARIEGTCTGTGTTTDALHETVIENCTWVGTGRLEGATGSWTVTIQLTHIGFDPATNTVLDQIDARGVGELNLNKKN